MRYFSLFSFCIAVAYFFGLASPVHALVVFPARETIIVNPGETRVVSLHVKNDGQEQTAVFGEADAFDIDEFGSAVFGKKDEALKWIQTSSVLIDLPEGAEETITFTIRVPAEAEPGMHHLGLFAREAPKINGAVALGVRGGMLLFLQVGGT